jgi:hypothetical protein
MELILPLGSSSPFGQSQGFVDNARLALTIPDRNQDRKRLTASATAITQRLLSLVLSFNLHA